MPPKSSSQSDSGATSFPPIAEHPHPAGSTAPEAPSSSSAPPPRSDAHPAEASQNAGKKKSKKRGGRKKKRRRESFALHDPPEVAALRDGQSPPNPDPSASSSFYRLGNTQSTTSLESEALLDHRDHEYYPPARRGSVQQGLFPRSTQSLTSSPHRPSVSSRVGSNSQRRSRLHQSKRASESEDDRDDVDDRTPLMAATRGQERNSRGESSYGVASTIANKILPRGGRSKSRSSSKSDLGRQASRSTDVEPDDFDVNNPPSVPASPRLGGSYTYDDALLMGTSHRSTSPNETRSNRPRSKDAVIDIDIGASTFEDGPQGLGAAGMSRRHTLGGRVENDVCFPGTDMSVVGEEDEETQMSERPSIRRRRRRRQWPDLPILEEWSEQERSELAGDARTRKVSEPLLVEGRLRPSKMAWQRDDSEAPYRWTYFNQEFSNTVHSHTISELLQDGQTFRDLFIPDPPELSDSSSDEEDDYSHIDHQIGHTSPHQSLATETGHARAETVQSRTSVRTDDQKNPSSGEQTGTNTPIPRPQRAMEKPKRFGERPVFWLDVLSPTEAEMRVLQRAFGIHPLTSEDIMMQEAREKVELFRNYYFVNYRTFDQDVNSEEYMSPINMYAVVFHEGVISFHFSQTPHPANVRRRIRQLSEWLLLSSDWISYGLIDDITDAYQPLVHSIEEEVDQIDDDILEMHTKPSRNDDEKRSIRSGKGVDDEKVSKSGDDSSGDSSGDMLRRVGHCRKKVMSLYRLLGNKADVIKGFAKRCNEQWQVAPRSEIGLYLGDIQDHIITMNSNLSHYENLLSRAHSNYLAQINIKSTERQEETADVLGKLTVLGTIVLPMNIVTGLWGMNCLVPGQDVDSLTWFWCLTAGLFMFGFTCFFTARRVYGIV